jgi:hypothetical protein
VTGNGPPAGRLPDARALVGAGQDHRAMARLDRIGQGGDWAGVRKRIASVPPSAAAPAGPATARSCRHPPPQAYAARLLAALDRASVAIRAHDGLSLLPPSRL